VNGARKFLDVPFAYIPIKKMKCYPESEDCKSEYDLEEKDFYVECNCDFYEKK